MIASYILSRTLVPTLAMYLLKAHKQGEALSVMSSPVFKEVLSGSLREFARPTPLCWHSLFRFGSPSSRALLLSACLRSPWFRFLARIFFPDTHRGWKIAGAPMARSTAGRDRRASSD
jgi:multidrug efflux pump subunit AcrB